MLTIEQAAHAILNVSKNARNVTDTERAIDAMDNWEWTTEELEKDMEDYFFEQWEAEYLTEVI